jgi:CubicO group peptidase (beta-lactamase class C family)
MTAPALLQTLPPQPAATPWPTADWPAGGFPSSAVEARALDHLEAAFAADSSGDLGETHAVVIVQHGRLIAERYAPGYGPDVTCRSWSMAKSITQALIGLAASDGQIDIHAPADVPAWRSPGDPRGAITLDHLLRMSSGLAWIEDYIPGNPSDVIAMLFAEGREDVAAYAEAVPQAHKPGSYWQYSSGTTNIIAHCLARALGVDGAGMEAFMRERLFGPLGMTSASPSFDAAGTFIGSSFCFCTPRDFARFGLLYLRDGMWENRRLLPEGWVDYARTPTFQQADVEPDSDYGAHWWLNMVGPGSFSANGYEGQHIVICPDRDLILVRHGATPTITQPAVMAWLSDLAGLFA